MKKKVLFILILVLIILPLGATTTLAAEPVATPTTTIELVAETKTLTVTNPFTIKKGAISVNIPENGEIYPGQKIATVPLTIGNQGNMPYLINISVQPLLITEGYPSFDLKVIEKNTTYLPWQLPAIKPGTTRNIEIEMYVSYGSNLASFKGLNLRVSPGPYTEQSGKG